MGHESLKQYFHKQYDEYADALFRFCFFKVNNRDKALDITQEVFMRFWDKIQGGEHVNNPRAFLYKVARNLIIDWYRKKKDDSLDALKEDGLEIADDSRTPMPMSTEEGAEIQRILAIIQGLDDGDRDVLIMRYVEGLPPKEIAEILGESANAVSVRINRAIKKVQEKAMQYE